MDELDSSNTLRRWCPQSRTLDGKPYFYGRVESHVRSAAITIRENSLTTANRFGGAIGRYPRPDLRPESTQERSAGWISGGLTVTITVVSTRGLQSYCSEQASVSFETRGDVGGYSVASREGVA